MDKLWPDYLVVCNIGKPHHFFKLGARVTITDVPGFLGSVEVRGRSRGGRFVTTWIATNYLSNARVMPNRVGIVPPVELRETDIHRYHSYSPQELADIINSSLPTE